jgi:hypothetical protein
MNNMEACFIMLDKLREVTLTMENPPDLRIVGPPVLAKAMDSDGINKNPHWATVTFMLWSSSYSRSGSPGERAKYVTASCDVAWGKEQVRENSH